MNQIALESGVYILSFPPRSEVYLGQTVACFYEKYLWHHSQLRKGSHPCERLQSLFNLLSKPPTMKVLEVVDKSTKPGPIDPKWTSLYSVRMNHRVGGKRGYPSLGSYQIWRLRNKVTGRRLLCEGHPVSGWNNVMNNLRLKEHRNELLQKDFNEHGYDSFAQKILATTTSLERYPTFLKFQMEMTENDYTKPPRELPITV